MITVYHVPNELFRDVPHFQSEAQLEFARKNKSKYIKVATVNTDNLDDAFMLTNTIDRPWCDNAEVRSVGFNRYRSTSCGDILQHGNDIYVVLSNGFGQL